MNSLRNKNILLIIPKFFGYETKICEELEKYNKVYTIYENINRINIFYKVVFRLPKKEKQKLFDSYFLKQFKKIQDPLDYVFVIRGEFLSKDTLVYLKKQHPKAKYIMYQWDSVKNNINALDIADLFDEVSTFDMKDAKEYGWIYRPLFYFNTKTNNWKDRRYDLLFVCSIHSQRVKIYNSLKNISSNLGLESFLYIFSKRLGYFRNKYIKHNGEFVDIDDKDVRHKSLNLNEMEDLYANSRIVIDYAHPNQNGLTMRSIESIGAHCKLITNNQNIKDCDFYNPNNIEIYKDNINEISKEFIETPYKEIDKEIFDKYSLDKWLEDIFK